jgi:predicted amidohydrolase
MELPVFDTPAGRLGVLVCADSWYPAVYRRLKEEQVELIAVPSYAAGKGLWEQPWQGYNGASAPADVDPQDAGKITEGQAWEKYALSGRMESAGARYGVNVFLRGELWNLGTDGYSRIVCEGETAQSTSEKAALLNLWL